MADTSYRTPSAPKSKTAAGCHDNQTGRKAPKKSAAMIERLRRYGIPKAIAENFPLTPHEPTRRWCKKLPTPRGPRVCYFGSIDDWQGALEQYEADKADITTGRERSSRADDADGLRLHDLCNKFLHFKRGRVNTGELSMRSWHDYHQSCERILRVFGPKRIVETLRPEDFERLRDDYAEKWKAVRLGNEVNRARILFRFAYDNDLIEKPVKFGAGFERPSRQTMRKVRANAQQLHGRRMFTADELRTIIDKATQPMKAMVLLGINGGFHNMDVAKLPMHAVRLDEGWIEFARGKTGIPRRVPLWPETVSAIREWLAIRPAPKYPDDGHLLFLTKQRRPWYRLGRFVESDGATTIKGIDNPISKSFRVLLDNLGIAGKRNFLALRHGFRTIARGAKDREATDSLMGHVDESMAAHYKGARMNAKNQTPRWERLRRYLRTICRQRDLIDELRRRDRTAGAVALAMGKG